MGSPPNLLPNGGTHHRLRLLLATLINCFVKVCANLKWQLSRLWHPEIQKLILDSSKVGHYTSSAGQVCRASLPDKSAGQVCRASLPGKSAGQVCRASLPGKSAGQVCRRISVNIGAKLPFEVLLSFLFRLSFPFRVFPILTKTWEKFC
jgi:hypothetical protein